MRTDRFGRRMFLTGSGLALAMPFLPSLRPRNAVAQDLISPLRYVQVINMYGGTTRHFYSDLASWDKEQVAEGVLALSLSDIDRTISRMVSKEFDPYRSKINLIHGMDVNCRNTNHNRCFPTCASAYDAGLDGVYPPVSAQPSVDVQLADSSRVYADGTPNAWRLLTLSPIVDGTGADSFSWRPSASGKLELVQSTRTTLGLRDLLEDGFTAAAPNPTEIELMNAVYDDYKNVLAHPRLGSADKERFEAYVALVQDAAKLAAEPPRACTAPISTDETNVEVAIDNQVKWLAAAMSCGINKVASITLLTTASYDVRHTEHHDVIATSDEAGLVDDLAIYGRAVAKLVAAFDGIPDGDGTLLDNSIIYWSSQYGNAKPGDVHRAINMPVMVAGGAGGQLRTGYYLDYRKDGHLDDTEGRGIPLNNLLVTFMNCMGLTSSDYEVAGRTGYGDYVDSFFESTLRPDTDWWSSTEGKRSPLPFLYQGSSRG